MRTVALRPTSTLMSVRLCGALALVAGALFVAGCGGGEATSSASAAGRPISLRELASSASTSAQAKSGRFSFDMSMTFPGGDEPFAFSGEGAFDEASGRASFAVDMWSLAKLLGGLVSGLAGGSAQAQPNFDDPAGWRVEVVQDGDVAYLRFPAIDDRLPRGKSWIREGKGDTSYRGGFDFDQLEQFAGSDPRKVLESLRAVSSDIETVGTEQLRGVETAHYRAKLDPAELMKVTASGQAPTGSLVDQLTAQSGLGPVPVDVWIDATGLVRKLALSFEASRPGTSDSGAVSMSFELWDYDEPVVIDLPPASQVADASALSG
jgi:hypothetical protein